MSSVDDATSADVIVVRLVDEAWDDCCCDCVVWAAVVGVVAGRIVVAEPPELEMMVAVLVVGTTTGVVVTISEVCDCVAVLVKVVLGLVTVSVLVD